MSEDLDRVDEEYVDEGIRLGSAIAMRMELKKYSMRQTKDGYVIGFVIHPSDVNLDMVNSPIGTVYNAAFVESEQP